MRVVLQRVSKGSVTVDGQVVGAVARGFVALVGVTHADTRAEAELLARKTANLRVFEDDQGKLNLSALDIGGGVLVISQFTLYADRPGSPPWLHRRRPPDVAAARRVRERLRRHPARGKRRVRQRCGQILATGGDCAGCGGTEA
jgi:D-tyrosyl-tRNA(Tyr) deacylase